MADKTAFRSVTPLIPAGANFAEGLRFYVEEMGFEVVWQHGSMAGVRRGDVQLNLCENDSREYADNTSLSFGVDDLEALYEEYRGCSARVGPLEMKFWGRREFHMVLASGVCLQFYQAPS